MNSQGKMVKVLAAMAENPRKEKELCHHWCKRVAAVADCHFAYVYNLGIANGTIVTKLNKRLGSPNPGELLNHIGLTGTATQMRIREAMTANPWKEGQSRVMWMRDVAKAADCTWGYVQQLLVAQNNERVGLALREKETKKSKALWAFTGNMGPVTEFTNWLDVFYKFFALASAYRNFARQRNDDDTAWAASFLDVIAEAAERAGKRASMAR